MLFRLPLSILDVFKYVVETVISHLKQNQVASVGQHWSCGVGDGLGSHSIPGPLFLAGQRCQTPALWATEAAVWTPLTQHYRSMRALSAPLPRALQKEHVYRLLSSQDVCGRRLTEELRL